LKGLSARDLYPTGSVRPCGRTLAASASAVASVPVLASTGGSTTAASGVWLWPESKGVVASGPRLPEDDEEPDSQPTAVTTARGRSTARQSGAKRIRET